MRSSTLANNTASSFAGAILAVGRNGNPDATAPVTMKNTLLSNNGNSTNAILIAPLLTSQGFNISNIALPQLTFTGDASPANTALGPLANNGGPVRTRAPSGGSSALDGGFSTSAFFDARGFARQLDLPTITNFEFGDASDTDVPVRALYLEGVNYANVHKNKPAMGHECAAPKQNGKCDLCRACWDKNVKVVSYHEH